MTFRLDDFVDMRTFEIGSARRLALRASGTPIDADLYAAAAGDYLVTAVKIRRPR
jgi:hypothetical protein